MKKRVDDIYSVLTGDIIKSRTLSIDTRKQALQVIQKCTDKVEAFSSDLTVTGPEIYRGDGWQMLLSQPQYSLRAAFYLRALLIVECQINTRVSIGIGKVDDVPAEGLSFGSGDAFLRSGKGLDTMKKREYLVCWMTDPGIHDQYSSFDGNQAHANVYLNCALQFAGSISNAWSKTEALAVLKSLEGQTQAQIAEEWIDGRGTTQQNVAKTLQRTGWSELELLITSFEREQFA